MDNTNLGGAEKSKAEAEALTSSLGIGSWPLKAFAQLYRNGVSIGAPHYSSSSAEIEIEIAVKNDGAGALDILDAMLAPYRPRRSSGLSRVASFASAEEFQVFTQKLSRALVAGFHAHRAGVSTR